MNNPLMPEARADKDGKVVRRWVKVLETGEPAIPIPAPKSPDQKHLSESLFAKMYVDVVPETGYLIDACGREVYYTYEFTEHVLNLLPTVTLRRLAEQITDSNDSEQSYLMMPLFKYVDTMYERESDDHVDEIMKNGVTSINNALVFHRPLGIIAGETNMLRMAEDYMYVLNAALEVYEGTRSQREVEFEEHTSKVDYSKLPKKDRNRAIGFVTASCLTRSFTETKRTTPSPEAVDLMADNVDRLQDVVDVAAGRGFEDMEMIRELLKSDVPSLREGML